MKIAIATKNQNKVRELNELINIDGVEFISLKDLDFDGEIEENGNSFEENAKIKAEFVSKHFNLPAISDDSGLCVDALNGAPGIFSARYASENSENSDDLANVNKLLNNLKDVPTKDRTAHFVCAMAFSSPDGTEFTVIGKCFGHITEKPYGNGGFGYDPVFFSNDLSKNFGEASDKEKNLVSHRALAAKQMAIKLREIYAK